MLIRVTADHIRRGSRGLCTTCPVALAIAAALPGSTPWVVLTIQITRHGRKVEIETPDAVRDWIQAFDRGDEVRPFEFELALDHSPVAA